MRKIISKEQEAKRQKKNQAVLVAFLVLILLGSTFGIIVDSFNNNTNSSDKLKYNGKEFVYQNGYWVLEDNGLAFGFVYHPEETGNLAYEKNELDDLISYSGVPVYIYSNDSNAGLEIYRNIFPVAERVQDACPVGKTCEKDIPPKDCSERFIIIESSEKNEIVQENKCVYIRGNSEDLIKLGDEFLYDILGVK